VTAETLLVLQEGAEIHRLYLDSVVLGRSHGCDLSFDKQGVSRRHCEVVLRTDGVLVRDLGSTHGTFVDGNQVGGETLVHVGAVIRLGETGPRLRVLDARLAGQPLGSSRSASGGRPQKRPGRHRDGESQPHVRDGPGAHPSAPPRVARTETVEHGPARSTHGPADSQSAASPSTRPALARGLVIGTLVGLALGLAILVLFGMDPWLAIVRDAVGAR